MRAPRTPKIEWVPIEQIAVVNPRARGRVKFKQIVDSISHLGLKKPVTVTPRRSRNGAPRYDLVCGQGRLEACQALGQSMVPAFVVQASRKDLMLMSLAENLARRVRSAPELMAAIASLKEQGYTHAQIGKKTDLTATYVAGVLRLLNKGEERLLRAVECQQIPLSVAIAIATSDEADLQRSLAEAYPQPADSAHRRPVSKAEPQGLRASPIWVTGRMTGIRAIGTLSSPPSGSTPIWP